MRKEPGKDNLVVLVTGAATGIGAAIATAAVARGHRVLLTDIDADAVRATAHGLGERAAAFPLDIRDAEAWGQAFDAAEAEFGPVDVLVGNAGIIHTGNARDLGPRQHRDMVEVNLLGTMTGICTALPRMTARGRGHLVTVCSMSSFLPLPGYAAYGATKHAVRAFHHAVALEERHGPLDFTIVHPPSTRTKMLEQELADPTSAVAFAEKAATPEDVAEAVVAAIAKKPVEVVFPAVGGRVQRLAGALPVLIRRVMPVVEAKGRRARERLVRVPR